MAGYALASNETALRRFLLTAETAYESEHHLWREAGIGAGAAVADAGCGPGAMTVRLGKAVGSGGRVIAIDQDPGALAMARRLAGSAGLENMSFHQADLASTGLSSNSMDAIMLRNVLSHNGGQEQAIVDHLASCVRPEGYLYVVDVDLAGLHTQPDIAEIREINECYRDFQEGRHNDVSVGLKLEDLLVAAGLEPIRFQCRYDQISGRGLRPPAWDAGEAMVSARHIDAYRLNQWKETFDKLEEGNVSITYFVPFFTAIGRRRG